MIFNYKRVSTAEQNTERQLLEIECDREFVETASGKDTQRPELQALLGVIRKDDVINIHELSRLGRNTQDLLNIVKEIVDKGACVKFHKENLVFDGTKKDDVFQKLMLTIFSAISTFERDLLLERQREGIALAKKRGKYKGRPSRFNIEKINEIKKLFKERNNKAELAKELGVSRGYLYQLAKSS